MTRKELNALDRHITGNYGEDQFKDHDEDHDVEEPMVLDAHGKPIPQNGLCPICGEVAKVTGRFTANRRIILSCGDACTSAQWLEAD